MAFLQVSYVYDFFCVVVMSGSDDMSGGDASGIRVVL